MHQFRNVTRYNMDSAHASSDMNRSFDSLNWVNMTRTLMFT